LHFVTPMIYPLVYLLVSSPSTIFPLLSIAHPLDNYKEFSMHKSLTSNPPCIFFAHCNNCSIYKHIGFLSGCSSLCLYHKKHLRIMSISFIIHLSNKKTDIEYAGFADNSISHAFVKKWLKLN
jgi:hypothetical protein